MTSNGNSFVAFVRRNPLPSGIAGVLLLVAIVFLTKFIIKLIIKLIRGGGGSMGPGSMGPGNMSELPEISISGTKKVKSVNTSDYQMMNQYEYAGQVNGGNVDITLTVTTKSGFEDLEITSLKINRNKTNATGDLISTKTIDIKDFKSYTVLFSGAEITEDVVESTGGFNLFSVIGIMKDGTEYNSGTPLISDRVEISVDDLNYTLATVTESAFTFTPVASGLGSSKFSSRTPYYLSFEPDRAVYILPGTDSTKYKFRYLDTDNLFIMENNINEWGLDKLGTNYRLFNGDKILTLNDTGSFKLEEPGKMSAQEAKRSLVRISESPVVDPFPKNIPGLTGRYTVNSATAASWNDVSGVGHHAPVTKGSLKLDDIDFVYGGPDVGIQFPVDVQGVDNQYTLFYVMRYNGVNKGRIFDGTDGNWLSGFHNGSSGVAHHGESITDLSAGIGDIGSNPWVLGADTLGLYRANQMDLTRGRAAAYTGTTSHITINAGKRSDQLSDWAAKEVIIYNRVLDLPEIKRVEVYLSEAYGIPKGQGYTPGMKDNGYFAYGIGSPKGNGLQGQTIDTCRAQAVAASVAGFGFRKSSVAVDAEKETCFLYGSMDAAVTGDWRHDIHHSLHCTNAAGIVEDECMVPA